MIKETLVRFLNAIPVDRRDRGWFRGRDFSRDIAVTCPKTTVRIVFDIGAHVGEESRRFLKCWPQARIYAFEPTPATFQILKSKNPHSRMFAHQLAMSSSAGTAQFVAHGLGTSNRLTESQSSNTIKVAKSTIDLFCEQQSIPEVDVLKIDTEGHELAVLNGAEKKLKAQEIGFIRAECGVDPNNDRHVPYGQITELLLDYGYFLFGVYDQENEFFRNEPQLRRFDLAFISGKERDNNSGVAKRWPDSLLNVVVRLKHRLNRKP